MVARAQGARVQEETSGQEMARALQVGKARAVAREPAAVDMAPAVGGDPEMAMAQAGVRATEGVKVQEVGKSRRAMVSVENL